jgi:hypothetical protein
MMAGMSIDEQEVTPPAAARREARFKSLNAVGRALGFPQSKPGTTRLWANRGKFRVVGVDTFEGPSADYLVDDYDTLAEAVHEARQRGGVMNPVYVYDDQGNNVFSCGTP